MNTHSYIAIDLKSFYASVECVERGRDPLTTHLVVADAERSDQTICLAVSPSLKALGVPGRPRLFEVKEQLRRVNHARGVKAGASASDDALVTMRHPGTAVSFITATPRMRLYIDYSTRIYDIYLRYVAPEDIHVYSIDEVFMDVSAYLRAYALTPLALTRRILHDVLAETGITATAGIGDNLYLAKIAMDIGAKKAKPDASGARIAQLDEMRYRQTLWAHMPLTDFWRIGRGYAKKLAANGLFTMGDIARCSVGGVRDFYNEDLLYRLFGVNAELLIDHAWGYEPCTMRDIKSYRPASKSLSSGQVLPRPYHFAEARLITREMTDLLVLELVEKGLQTGQVVLTLGYERTASAPYAHGSSNLTPKTASAKIIMDAVTALYDRIVGRDLPVRRINICCTQLAAAAPASSICYEQLSLFSGGETRGQKALEKEARLQEAVLQIHRRYGKNALLRGMNLEEAAMTITRNQQIGGHKA